MSRCVAGYCLKPGVDEYHWFDGDREVVWVLCETHCNMAIEVVECISNLETEMETWTE